MVLAVRRIVINPFSLPLEGLMPKDKDDVSNWTISHQLAFAPPQSLLVYVYRWQPERVRGMHNVAPCSKDQEP